MAPLKRNRILNFRITDEEHAMLFAVAEREGVSVAGWLRQQIRAAYREAFGDRPPEPKT